MIDLLILLFLLAQYGRAQQTFFPPAIPLAVRSPYLSCWDFTTNGTTIGKLWSTTSAHQPDSTINDACCFPSLDVTPKFTAFQNLSIPVHVRVDNITYSFLGYSPSVNGSVNLTNTIITPTQTKLTAQAGPMQFNLTFLNPIEVRTRVRRRLYTYTFVLARRLGQAINPVLVPVVDCGIAGRRGSCCAGVFGCQWRWVRSLSLFPLRCFSKLLQNGCQQIEPRRLDGVRRLLIMSSTIGSTSRIQPCSTKSALRQNGAHCTMPWEA